MSPYEEKYRKAAMKDEPDAGSSHETTVRGASFDLSAWIRRLKQAGPRIARRLGREEAGGVRVENIVWIFGAGRTGSTWLSQMMGEIEGHSVWFEPWVGALFDPYHLRLEHRKGRHFILTPRYRSTWLKSIRSFVLDGAGVRFPEVSKKNEYLVIKEPGGSVGAPLLIEAVPESRMILLVRDPRDVAASWMDARRKGGWRHKDRNQEDGESETLADRDPLAYMRKRAKTYLQVMGNAKQAYEAHEGYKVLVRYEDLRADTLGTMKRIYSTLEIPVEEAQLVQAVNKHAWENIPEDEKGQGKFYRKATPGGWKEDLTQEQVKTVEKITAPLLDELYPPS